MSVTVADLLCLPSLRLANVLGGHKGLNKIVSSISVLESINPSLLTDEMFGKSEYLGSEIVITGFVNCAEDVECQCANIRRLAEGGEVGLILFYVGIFMPKVDQKLIDLANELDFVLIQMPSMKNLRYSEVINDVMEYIFNDRTQNESIVTDILARISVLQEGQRTIDTVLRMISDRLLASVIMTDDAFQVLNMISWPQSMENQLKMCVGNLKQYAIAEGVQEIDGIENGKIYHFQIYGDGGVLMHLFLVKEGGSIGQMLQEQIEDIVRICMNIWGKEHGTIAVRELIRAILQDEPIKMRRLSDIFHIDVESIHEMWILRGDDLQKKIDQVLSSLKMYAETVIADVYEEQLIVFSSTPRSEKEAEEVIKEIIKDDLSLIRCSGLQNTRDVRRAYICCQKYFTEAIKIYPGRKWFRIGDMEYVQSCCELVEQGEASLTKWSEHLRRIRESSEEWDAIETLGVYLLDADMSVTRTAEKLFLHKNTVKYRLKMIADTLGFRPDKMPESIGVYQALAIQRLLK